MSDQVDQFNMRWGRLAGLSKNNAREMTATAGAIVQGMGASEQASAGFAQRMLTLSGDLTSFHNVPIADTFTAIKAALAGSWEPLDRFGIVIRQDDVNLRALADTGKRSAGELTALDKAMAALTLASERAGPAIGDLNRTAGSNGNMVRQLQADYQNWKESLAKDITPQVTNFIHWLSENRDAISALATVLVVFLGGAAKGIINFFDSAGDAAAHFMLVGWNVFNAGMARTMMLGANILDLFSSIAEFFENDDLARRLKIRADALERESIMWRQWADNTKQAIADVENRGKRRDMGLPAKPGWQGPPAPVPGATGVPAKGKTPAQIAAEQAAAAKARDAAEKAANKALEDRIERLTMATRFDNTRARATDELRKLEDSLTKQLTRENLTLDQTIEKSSQLQKVREALGEQKPPKPLALMTTEERVSFAAPLLDVPGLRRQAQDILKGVNAELEVKLVLAGDNIEKAAPILSQMRDVQELLGKPIENKSLDERLALLERMNQVGQFGQRVTGELLALERQLSAEAHSQTATTEEQVAAAERLNRVRAMMDVRIDLLARALTIEGTRIQAAKELNAMEARVSAQLRDQTLTLDEHVAAVDRLNRVRAAQDARMDFLTRALQFDETRIQATAELRDMERDTVKALDAQRVSLEDQLTLKQRLASVRAQVGTGEQDVERLRRAEIAIQRDMETARASGDRQAMQAAADRLDAVRTELTARQRGVAALLAEEKELTAILGDQTGEMDRQAAIAAELVRLRERLAAIRVRLDAGGVDLAQMRRQEADIIAQRDAAAAAGDAATKARMDQRLADLRKDIDARTDAAQHLRDEEQATLAALEKETAALAEQVRLKQRLAQIRVGIQTGTQDTQRLEREEGTTRAQMDTATDPRERERLAERLAAIRAERAERERSTEALRREEQDTLAALNAQTKDLAEQVRLKERLAKIRADLDMAPGGQGARVDDAERRMRLPGHRAEGIEELRKIEAEITEQLKDQNLATEERLRLEERLKRVRGTLDEGGNRGLPEAKDAMDIILKPLGSIFDAIKDVNLPVLDWLDDILGALGKTLPAAAEEAAQVLMDTMGHALDLLLEGTFTLKGAFGTLGKDLAKGILSEIGKMAKGKALENIALAIEEGAKSLAAAATLNFPGAAAHGAAALKFTLAAAKWGAVAGGVGAIGGGGGGSSVGASGSRIGGEAADSKKREKALVVIKGGLINTDDDRQMDALMDAITRLRDYDVEVRRG
jgi:hypothetical protein